MIIVAWEPTPYFIIEFLYSGFVFFFFLMNYSIEDLIVDERKLIFIEVFWLTNEEGMIEEYYFVTLNELIGIS